MSLERLKDKEYMKQVREEIRIWKLVYGEVIVKIEDDGSFKFFDPSKTTC